MHTAQAGTRHFVQGNKKNAHTHDNSNAWMVFSVWRGSRHVRIYYVSVAGIVALNNGLSLIDRWTLNILPASRFCV